MLGTWSIGMLENRGSYAAAVARRDFEGVIAKIAEPLGDLVTVGGEKTMTIYSRRFKLERVQLWERRLRPDGIVGVSVVKATADDASLDAAGGVRKSHR
jgi:hypothetical protein